MSDTRQIVRQLDILRTLAAQTYGLTYRKLANESGVSTRTIQRDLDDLLDAGFIIESPLLRLASSLYQTSGPGTPSQEIEELDNGNITYCAITTGQTKTYPITPLGFSYYHNGNAEIILSFQAGGFYEIKSWILSHGADARSPRTSRPARRNNGDTPKKSEVL